MTLKWLGHSAFLLTAGNGTRIITDPYTAGSYDGAVGYDPIDEPVDGVTQSHDHADHSGHQSLPGNPRLVTGTGEFNIGDITVRGFHTWHDHDNGALRGDNVVYLFDIDGLRVCHLGDLGHVLPDETIHAIGRVDVLLVPVGGVYTIDAAEAHEVAGQLGARVVIPMHFKTAKLGFDIAPIDDFIADRPHVTRVGECEVEILPDKMPAEQSIWVLDHAF